MNLGNPAAIPHLEVSPRTGPGAVYVRFWGITSDLVDDMFGLVHVLCANHWFAQVDMEGTE